MRACTENTLGTTRQAGLFAAIGALQWLLDSAVMVALSHAGLAVALATVAGRVTGACAGYWLNGRYTFASSQRGLSPRALRRFVIFWLLCTALSAWLLACLDAAVGLHWAWLGKPLVDAGLALVGFWVSRHWIYPHARTR